MPCNGTKGQIFIPRGPIDNYLFIILSYEALHIRSIHRIIHIFNFQLWFLKHIRIDQDIPYTLPMEWMTWRHDTLFSLEWSPTLPLFQKRLTFPTLALTPPSPSFLFTLTLPIYIGYPKLHPFSTPLIIHPFHPLYSYPFHKTHYTPFIEPPPYTTPSDCISFEKYKNSKNIQVDFDHNYTNRTF